MGLFDNFRSFFSKDTTRIQKDEEYEKSILSEKIVDLVNKIKRINSFDKSIWSLSNISSCELKRKSIDELKTLYSTLENRLSELSHQRISSEMEAAEAAKWTGERTGKMTEVDLDRFQKGDDYR